MMRRWHEASRGRRGWRDTQEPDPTLTLQAAGRWGRRLKDACLPACRGAWEHQTSPAQQLAWMPSGQPGGQRTGAEVAQLKLHLFQEASLDLPSYSHLQARFGS